MIKNTYTNIGDHLLMCDGVISPDGEVIKVTAADKLILAFMHHRWHYFVVEQKGEYRDSMEYIALRTGNNVKTVERCVSKFTKAGVLLAEKRFDKKKKHNKWFWLGFSDVVYVQTSGNSMKEVISSDIKDYNPKGYYKQAPDPEVVLPPVPEYIRITPPDFDMIVPHSDYDNDFAMSVWEVGT